jgi:hypothetical protein
MISYILTKFGEKCNFKRNNFPLLLQNVTALPLTAAQQLAVVYFSQIAVNLRGGGALQSHLLLWFLHKT